MWRLALAFAAPLIIGDLVLVAAAYTLIVSADTRLAQARVGDGVQAVQKLIHDLSQKSDGTASGAGAKDSENMVQLTLDILAGRIDARRKPFQTMFRYEDRRHQQIGGDRDYVVTNRPVCPWWPIQAVRQCFSSTSDSQWYFVDYLAPHTEPVPWGLAQRVSVSKNPNDGVFFVGSRFALEAEENDFLAIAGWALAGAAASLMIGFLVARSMLRRVEAVNRICDRVTNGDWRARAEQADAKDEFGALARHVNGMIDHIDSLIVGISQVTNIVTHDLRAPITKLKKSLETLAVTATLEAAHDGAEVAAETAAGILVTFDTLLDINAAEAGGDGRLQPMQLEETAMAAAALLRDVAEAAEVRLDCHTEPARILGKADQLLRLSVNLLDNAIKYSPPGGVVTVSVSHRDGEVLLTVADQGPGIPVAERQAMLSRGARGEATRHIAGHGVGLSIVKAVAVGHGTKLRMTDAAPGLIVTVPFRPF